MPLACPLPTSQCSPETHIHTVQTDPTGFGDADLLSVSLWFRNTVFQFTGHTLIVSHERCTYANEEFSVKHVFNPNAQLNAFSSYYRQLIVHTIDVKSCLAACTLLLNFTEGTDSLVILLHSFLVTGWM